MTDFALYDVVERVCNTKKLCSGVVKEKFRFILLLLLRASHRENESKTITPDALDLLAQCNI